ncbi:L-asparaginase [Salipiger sp. CCB-MM3]|uniref:asparaginase n=1 Tax=Salipiger sp. CCB-MM3 TaxID=1792508 RepID=UPI00080AAF52|nr:asparaginase [Salipiger sp. CCB-MM3]ANT62590.1 L-asparaginase [Salipiger sp. CCB-MM3]
MPHIVLVATGGTIASFAQTEGGPVTAGLTGDALLKNLHAPLPGIEVTVDNLPAAGSNALTLETVHSFCRHIDARLAEPGVDGVVVTHGTDTMEESAFLARLLVKSDKPVVFTGAQRHAGQPDTDGPRNMRDALLTAATPDLTGVGAVIVFEGDIHGARYVSKVHSSRVDTFRSNGHGKLGEIDEGEVHLYSRPARPRFVIDTPALDPDVELVALGLGSTPRYLRWAGANGASGAVIEAFGRGNAPKGFADAARDLVAAGIPVILASRCPEGRTRAIYGSDSGGVTMVEAGALLAGDLSAAKARLLLAALLPTLPAGAGRMAAIAEAIAKV